MIYLAVGPLWRRRKISKLRLYNVTALFVLSYDDKTSLLSKTPVPCVHGFESRSIEVYTSPILCPMKSYAGGTVIRTSSAPSLSAVWRDKVALIGIIWYEI